MSDPVSDDEIVHVPVPRRHLAAVYRILAEAMAHGSARVSPSTGVPLPQPWTMEDISRLRQEAKNPTVRALLELTSERPGEFVSLRDIESRAGRTHAQARADLAGLTQLVKRRFGRANWPVEWRWAVGGDERAYYCMPKEIAEWWKSAT